MEGDDPPEQSTTPTAADTPAFCTRLSTEEAVAASREATAIELAKLAQLLDKAEEEKKMAKAAKRRGSIVGTMLSAFRRSPSKGRKGRRSLSAPHTSKPANHTAGGSRTNKLRSKLPAVLGGRRKADIAASVPQHISAPILHSSSSSVVGVATGTAGSPQTTGTATQADLMALQAQIAALQKTIESMQAGGGTPVISTAAHGRSRSVGAPHIRVPSRQPPGQLSTSFDDPTTPSPMSPMTPSMSVQAASGVTFFSTPQGPGTPSSPAAPSPNVLAGKKAPPPPPPLPMPAAARSAPAISSVHATPVASVIADASQASLTSPPPPPPPLPTPAGNKQSSGPAMGMAAAVAAAARRRAENGPAVSPTKNKKPAASSSDSSSGGGAMDLAAQIRAKMASGAALKKTNWDRSPGGTPRRPRPTALTSSNPAAAILAKALADKFRLAAPPSDEEDSDGEFGDYDDLDDSDAEEQPPTPMTPATPAPVETSSDDEAPARSFRPATINDMLARAAAARRSMSPAPSRGRSPSPVASPKPPATTQSSRRRPSHSPPPSTQTSRQPDSKESTSSQPCSSASLESSHQPLSPAVALAATPAAGSASSPLQPIIYDSDDDDSAFPTFAAALDTASGTVVARRRPSYTRRTSTGTVLPSGRRGRASMSSDRSRRSAAPSRRASVGSVGRMVSRRSLSEVSASSSRSRRRVSPSPSASGKENYVSQTRSTSPDRLLVKRSRRVSSGTIRPARQSIASVNSMTSLPEEVPT